MIEPAREVVCQPIGIVRSRFADVAGMPIQAAAAADEEAVLEVFPEYASGLRDVEGFEYLMLVCHFHLCPHEKLMVVPFLDDRSHGVFATRAPARPNRLGLSIVRLLGIEGNTLRFAGNDMVDGTPVLDIKPYVPRFDVRQTERIGWFAGRIERLDTARSDRRMQ